METKELKIEVPEGYEIDEEKSTFENIVFKKKGIEKKKWRDNKDATLRGYYIDTAANIIQTLTFYNNEKLNYNIFATEKQAKSALAMARISQIMVNDERFGGPITDDEWNDIIIDKYCIKRSKNGIIKVSYISAYSFIAFHTQEQCNLFLKENKDLVKDYFML